MGSSPHEHLPLGVRRGLRLLLAAAFMTTGCAESVDTRLRIDYSVFGLWPNQSEARYPRRPHLRNQDRDAAGFDQTP